MSATTEKHVQMRVCGDARLTAVADPAARVSSVAELAETYHRQVDELAAMVEAEQARQRVTTTALSVVADALGELAVALDEMGARAGSPDGGQ